MADFVAVERLDTLKIAALRKPPTWTRLEPQSTTGDPRPGLEARVHDPLWLLGRQWQLGEFEGEDAGTPLAVRVVTETTAVDRWAAGSEETTQWLAPHDLLEPPVEAEAPNPAGPGLRARAEAGAALVAALEDLGLAGMTDYRSALVDHAGLLPPDGAPAGADAELDPTWQRLTRLLRGRGLVDAELACAAFESAGGLPDWLAPLDEAEATALLDAWREWALWYRTEVAPETAPPDCWEGDRLEYHLQVAAGSTVLRAPDHRGGEIGWHSFDAAPGAVLPPGAGDPPEREAVAPESHVLLASPLRFPGMPADRLWEFEDGEVNLGTIDAEPWDVPRLLVAEFALTYGNDWLVVPVDVPYGSLTTVQSVVYTTTFGERFRVRPTEQVSPDGDWQLYAISGPATRADDQSIVPGESIDGLLIPPGAVAVQDGPAYEEVLFLRDEMANLAWAVERSVTGPSGLARDRSREATAPPPPDGPVTSAALDYRLQTTVPARWIPYVPLAAGYRSIELVQGAVPDADGTLVLPIGVLLNESTSRRIKDAEIPREGIVIRRVPSMTRRADGTYLRWTTRRVSVGRGEGASQLAFDSARPRKPRPNSQL